MGAKFFRGADKPKKIRKRVFQTRSWARTYKWTACNKKYLAYTIYRSCSSYMGCWTSIQGCLGTFNRLTPSPRD